IIRLPPLFLNLHLVPELVEVPGKVGERLQRKNNHGEEIYFIGEPVLPPASSHISLQSQNLLCDIQ
ncbi:hypothetical protein KI387_018551, partial [Taxus chinensis]